ILDFGSQYTQLIARRVRELGVHSEIHPCTVAASAPEFRNIKALILSGGPNSVLDPDRPSFDEAWLDRSIPILGICYGMQLLSQHFGGTVARSTVREYGHANFSCDTTSALFQNFTDSESQSEGCRVWMSHGDHVDVLPEGFRAIGSSSSLPIAAMEDAERQIFALQFHPEVAHTEKGTLILKNFLFSIAGVSQSWNAETFIQAASERIRESVPEDAQVVCGLSGGVDSTVAAVIVHRAIGQRLHCLFVDNGLLRKDEADQVEARLGKGGLGLPFHRIDARDRFLDELAGVTDPEQKRKIIGRVFIEVFEQEAKRFSNVQFLVQGTLYPDVIESVSPTGGPSVTIKSHHNVGGLPERMELKLIEPLRDLFKDEVRRFGEQLGIPHELLWRQPFPGPGLAVRILGEVTRERIDMLQRADAIYLQEVRAAGLYEQIWQSFAVLLPVNTVGVMGDERTYENAVALRAVTSQDGMTADWYYLPHELLSRVSNRIINEVKGINRVVFDISSKPPATIEWE
ncbi:MAG: glutamine-hydrolyzing GMP synthase, partial [Bdellovibrionales bacterium]|nr:glutamine-hydrolyzing GMP synthase [Bdellovibrionales bacterium]